MNSSFGICVCVVMSAGIGKSTMAALICDTHLQREHADEIIYFIFGKKAGAEANLSLKCDQKSVVIQTTHAFAKHN